MGALDGWFQLRARGTDVGTEVRAGLTVVRGVARGVDERGALLLDLEGGTRAALLSGEARELRLAGE